MCYSPLLSFCSAVQRKREESFKKRERGKLNIQSLYLSDNEFFTYQTERMQKQRSQLKAQRALPTEPPFQFLLFLTSLQQRGMSG